VISAEVSAVRCVASLFCDEGWRLATDHLSEPLKQYFGIPFFDTTSRQQAIGSRHSADAFASYA
jgi:hypothetical protein